MAEYIVISKNIAAITRKEWIEQQRAAKKGGVSVVVSSSGGASGRIAQNGAQGNLDEYAQKTWVVKQLEDYLPLEGGTVEGATTFDQEIVAPGVCSSDYSADTGYKIGPETEVDTISARQGITAPSVQSSDFVEGEAGYSVGEVIEANKISARESVIAPELQSPNYENGGLMGAGYRVGVNEDGSTTVEADHLIVRKSAQFNELVINQMSFNLGTTVYTAGGFEITEVEIVEGAYRCFYDNKDGKRYAGIVVGDQVRCQRYNEEFAQLIKFYWRLVVNVGDNYIDLSTDDYAEGSSAPEVGDNVVQFGNRADTTRQGIVLIASTGDASPRISQYAGVNHYSLEGKETARISPDGNFMSGRVSILEGSSGLENIDGWSDTQAAIETIQNQIENTTASWVGSETPTLDNYPVSNWSTSEMRSHLGDIYDQKVKINPMLLLTSGGIMFASDGSMLLDSALLGDTTARFRWSYNNGQYQWVEIPVTENQIQELDYLRVAIQDGTTTIDGGLVLASLLGVRGKDNNMVAAMSGVEGTPYFAAGIGDIADIANSSKMQVTTDGEIRIQDTSQAAGERNKARFNAGILEFMRGDMLALVHTPKRYAATPSDEMMFSAFAEIETTTPTDYIGSETDTATLSRAVRGTYDGNVSQTWGLASVQVGESYSSITTDALLMTIDAVDNYRFSLQVTPQLVVDGVVVASGSTVIFTRSNISGIIPAITLSDVVTKHNTVGFRLSIQGTLIYEPSSTIEIQNVPSMIITAAAGDALRANGNIARAALDNRVYGNGVFFATSMQQYVGFMVDDTVGAVFEMRNGSNGFRFSADGLQKWNGSAWVSM